MELLVVALITAAVIGMVGRLPDARKVKRELAAGRVEPIDSLPEGKAVTVRGTVAAIEPGDEIEAPILGVPCVYWLVVFDEVGTGGDYRELGRVERGVPFLLRSEQGTARVVPDRPRIALPGKAILRPITMPGELDGLARDVCKPYNYPSSMLRATFYTLQVGAFVTVRGWCTREPDPEASEDVSGYREALPTRPVISGSRRTKLMIG